MKAISLLCLSLVGSFSLSAQFVAPSSGFVSEAPAPNWEHSLLSGNGTMGAMVPGYPYDERLYLSHAAIYLPYEVSGNRFQQADRMDEIRRLCLEGKFKEAGLIINQIKKEGNFHATLYEAAVEDRDPFLPAVSVRIKQETGTTKRYLRSVNFATGEAVTEWQNEHGTFKRTVFVSRTDSVIVIRLTGDAPVNATVAFEEIPTLNCDDRKHRNEFIKDLQVGLNGERMSCRTIFKYSNPYNTLRGYESAGRVIHNGGKLLYVGNAVVAQDVSELIVLVGIAPLPLNTESRMNELCQWLDSRPSDYEALLKPSAAVQSELFGRVALDLHAPATDRALPTERLLALSQTGEPPLAMIERAFNAGRYNILSCMGYNPPNLLGLWSATWTTPWAGSFTTDGNIHTAMSFALPGNTPELMQAYFNQIRRMLDGFRTNARELFGTRGFHIPAQMTTGWATWDDSNDYPLTYWTAGTAWCARWFFDYYDYTGDIVFLRRTAYPLMKEAAAFYEDFLKIERDGKFVFVPSYSPENQPTSTGVSTCINATMEMAACRQLLRDCITAATILKTDKESIKRWQTMLTKLPDYEVSPEGALREWLWPGLTENFNHRHCSHLYGLFDELPEEFKNNPALQKAAEVAIDKRIEFFLKYKSGMAFGLCQAGWAAAHLGNARQTETIINYLSKTFWSTGMASFHDPYRLFNMDISGGYPYLVSQCLALSAVETHGRASLHLLPALPARWTQGSIEGLRLRGNIILKRLEWDKDKVVATLVAPYSGKIRVEYKGKAKTVNLVKDKAVTVKFN